MNIFTQTTFSFNGNSLRKLITTFGLLVTLFFVTNANSQAVSTYSFSATSGTYTALVSATTLINSSGTNMDSYASTAITIPSFTFGGTAYTTAYVTSNGQVTLGGSAPSSTTYTGISTGLGSGICICPFSADLDAVYGTSSSNIRYKNETGTNEFVFQWTGISRYIQSEEFNMQVRLNYSTGEIKFVYSLISGPSSGTSYQPEVGIRTSGTDFRNLSVTNVSGTPTWASPTSSGNANTAICRFTSASFAKSFTSGLTYTFTPPATYTSNGAGTDWNTATNWNVSTGGNGIPVAGSLVVIASNITASASINAVNRITINSGSTLTLNTAYTNPSGATITVNSGGTLALGATLTNSGTTTVNGTVQINGNGYAQGTNFSYAATGTTLIMNHNSGLYGISTGQAFWPTTNQPFNVTIQGTGAQINNTVGAVAGTLTVNSQLACAATPSVTVTGTAILASQLSATANGNFLSNGTLQINSGGFVSGFPPTYGSTSSLVYNSGSTSGSPYGVSTEWTASAATAGIGIPNNVTIDGNTFITMPSGNRGMAGTLNVTSGSGITLNASTGDLSVGGNFTQNGTFTHNTRAVNFFGTSATTQTITGSGLNTAGATNCFAYFLINNSNAGVTIGTNVTIDASAGDVLQFLNAGTLKIGAFTLTVNGNGGNILVNGTTGGTTKTIDFTSASGIMRITGSGGTLKTVTSAGSGVLSITSSVAGGQVQVQSGGFNCGSNLTTIQTGAFLTINTGGYVDTNSPNYATGSTLSFRTGAIYGVGSTDKTWASGASGAGVPDRVQINASGTDVQINDNRTARTSVTVTSGTLTNNTNTLTIATGTSAASALVINGGTYSNGGGTTTIGNASTTTSTSALTVSSGTLTNSSGTINVVNTGTTASNAVLINGGTYNNSGGTMNIGNAVTTVSATGALTISSGSLTNSIGTITIAGAATTASTTVVNITGGTLTNSGGTVNVGPTNGGNQSLTLNGGTLTISSGTVAVNGAVALTTGAFNMSAGNFNIDPNSGVSGSSVGATADILGIASAVTGTVNGGTILINDPLFAGTTGRALAYTGSVASRSWAGNTVQFGGANGNASTSTNGFNVNTFLNSANLQLGNVIANGGAVAGANRFVSGATASGNGFDIGGNLTINANSEVRTLSGGTVLRISGNIVNNGTLTDLAGIAFNRRSGSVITSNTAAQTVSGGGTFRNLITGATAKFTNLTFDNTLAAPSAAVTFSISDVTASGTVTLTNGIIDIGNNNSFNFVGTTSAVARTSGYVLIQGTGQMRKDFATGASAFTFHVGENTGTTEYSPYSINFSANSLARTIGVRVVDDNHPNLNDVDTQTDYISRYWQLSNSAAGTYTYTGTATYLADDINGTADNMKMNLWTGASPWSQLPSSAATNVLTITSGVTNTSAPLGATADFTGRVKGSTTYTWDGTTDSAWSTATNWTPDRTTPAANDILIFDGTSTPSPTVTGFASETISKLLLTNSVNLNLQPTTTATLTIAGGTGTDLDIPSGSTLNLSGGASAGITFTGATTTSIVGTLTFSSTVGIPTLDLTNTIATVTGTINFSSTSNVTVTSSSTSLLMNAGSTLNITNGMTAIPLATWDTTSTLILAGSGTTFTNNAQSFGNFTYNSSSITATVSFFTTTTTAVIKGNANIQTTGTGSGKFRFLTSGTLAVNGNVNVSNASNVDFMSAAASLTVTGNVNISNTAILNFTNGAGTINIGGSVTASNASIINFGNAAGANTTTITGNLNLNSSATSVLSLTSGSTQVVNVLGDFTQTAGTLSMGTGTGAGTLKVAGSFTAISVNNPGTGTANLIEFNGTSSQAVSPGASVTGVINFRVSNPSGIAVTGTLPLNAGTTFTAASSGTAVTSGTVTYSTTTTLSYTTAIGTQTTGNEFPATSGPVNVTFNNTFSTPEITLSGPRTVTGALTITAGRILLGSNDLTSSGTQSITTPGTSKMIVINGSGQYKRSIATGAANYLFPIGESTGALEYSPISLQFTANSVIRIVGAKVIDGVSTNMNSPTTPTNYLSRYWTFSENGAGGTYNYYINPAVAISGAEPAGDENGTAASIKAVYWNGSAWIQSLGSYTSGSLVSNATGVSETAAPLGLVEWTGRDNPSVSYTWVGFTDSSWNTGTNWNPAGVPGSLDTVTLTNGSTGAAANLNLTTAVTVANFTFNGSGNFFTVGASPAAIIVTGNVTYTGGTGSWNATSTFTISSASSQTIPAFGYGNLNASGGARVWSTGTTGIAGTFTPGSGAYTATSGSTVDYTGSGAQTIGSVKYYDLSNSGNGSRTLTTGTIDVANVYTPTTAATTPGTVNIFNFSSAGTQTIPASSYANITNTGNGNRILANSGTIEIAGATFTPGSGTYTVTGSTVNFSNATGLTIPALSPAATNNYNNLTISGAGAFLQGGSLTLGGNFNQSAGTYTVTSGASALSLTVSGNFTQSAGTFNVTGSSATAGATVTVNGNTSVFSISMSPSNNNAASLALPNSTNTILFQANGNATFTGSSTTTAFDWMVGGTSLTTYNITFGIKGNFNWSNTTGRPYVSGGGTPRGFVFNGTGTIATPQTLTYSGSTIQYGGDFIVSAGTVVKLLTNVGIGAFTNPYDVFTVNGTLDTSTFTVNGGATNGTFILASGATLRTANTNGIVSTTVGSVSNTINTRTFNAAANYEFYGNAAITANFANTIMNNLTNSSSNTTTQGTNITVNGDLNLTSGTLAGSTNTIALAGNITGTGTHTSTGAGIITMTGSGKAISGATLGNLTLNNVNGFSLTGSPTINGNLTFTNGNLDLNGSNNVTLGSTTTVTGETCSKQFTNSGSPSQGNGYVQTTPTFASGTNYLGITITSATALGSTNIKRFVQKSVTTPSGTNTIKRLYSITPSSAATGNVTLTSSYCDGELNGNNESSPVLITYYGTGTNETTGYSSVYANTSNDATANTVTTVATGSLIAGQNNITLANAGADAYYTVQDGNWGTAATWVLGAVPPSTADVTVKHIVTVAADATANSLNIDTGDSVTVASGFDLNITNAILNNGTLTIENNGNLLQTNNVANSGSGSTVVKRNSSALKRLDYTLWSSPVSGQGLYAFSKYTLPNRFYVYDTSADLYSNSLVGFSFNPANFEYPSPLTSPNGVNGVDDNNVQFATGKGYLIRVPYNHPTTPTVYNGIFTGVANNGNLSATVSTAGNGYNAVGNPYPSRLNVWDFIDGNENITGPLYFWRKTNTTGTSTSYATLTKLAYAANGSVGGDTGTGFFNSGQGSSWAINIGQGFIVKVNSGSTISFTNSMRRSLNADQFFKNSPSTNTVNNGLYWLNLTDNTGVYSQMVVGYSAEGTFGFDRGIDGENINKEFYLTSLIGTGEYSIQGRPDFDSADIVPLSYKAITAGNYTISIDHTAGLFTDVNQPIYVKDNVNATYHDLRTGAYNFASDSGTFTNRFEIVYALPLEIENPVFTSDNVIIYSQNNEFVVNSGNVIMSSIKVFDIRGRLLQEKSNINASQTTVGSGLANQVLLVQITSEDGVTVTKKVVR